MVDSVKKKMNQTMLAHNQNRKGSYKAKLSDSFTELPYNHAEAKRDLIETSRKHNDSVNLSMSSSR
jgi:hypothetical protein